MADPMPVRSAKGHIEMLEEMIAKHKARIASGDHMIDEATTRRWIEMDEKRLAEWRVNLRKAEAEASAPPPPLA